MKPDSSREHQLLAENADLRSRLDEAEEMLRAIRAGEVDSLVVESSSGPQIFALQGVDAEAARFRADILAQISEAVFAVDADGRVTYLNAAAERQYEVAASEVLGCEVGEIFENLYSPPDHREAVIEMLRRDGHWRGETLHIKHSGEAINVESSVSMLPAAQGERPGVLVVTRDVTDRRKIEDALRLSEQRFRVAVSTVSSLLWTNSPEGKMEGEQPGWEHFTGQKREEYQGFGWADAVHPDDAQPTVDAWNQTVAAKKPFEFEHRIRRADGAWRVCAVHAVPIFSADGAILEWVGVHTDITDRRQHEEALRHNEALFSTIIKQAPGGVYVVDDQLRLMQINALARPTFSAAEPVIGRGLGEIMDILWGPELGPELVESFRHTLETGERYISPRFTHQRNDTGEEKSYEWETQRLTLPNGKRGVVCYFTDTTDRYAQENALREAKETAEAANASKDRFLAVLSHELRTPLTPVLMAVSALEHDPDLRPDVREDIVMIKRNVELETKLIEDLLDLSRITSGKVELKTESVDLHEAVRQVIAICQPQLLEAQVQLTVELGQESCAITADQARLQQVLWNLLKNAIKFTPAQGRIHLSTARLAADRCEVRVKDSGIGSSPEILPRIFNAFEQGDPRITRQFGGLGLGLAISRALVTFHGGSIRAESDGDGKGATFIIEFPGGVVSPAHPEPVADGIDSKTPPQITLLLVEDHADTARTLTRLLRRAGFAVIAAHDVASAVAAIEREPFDLLVSDLGLPDGTGYEVMRAARRRRIVPGIAMSGYGMDEDVRRSLEAGFGEHLVKPVSIPQLIAAIRRVAATGA